MVLEEKGIAYKKIEEDLSNLSQELLALHPEGRVPLLVHEVNGRKEVIYQSTVITEYLDEVFPGIKLMPASPLERARVRLWTYWCDQLFKPDLDLYKYERPKMSAQEVGELEARLHGYFYDWNEALVKSPFLVDAQMTLADIHLFPFARQFLRIMPALKGVEKYTALKAWLDTVTSRPSFDRVMEGKKN